MALLLLPAAGNTVSKRLTGKGARLVKGQHFRFLMKLRLVLRVVDLLIARDDHDDRLVAELEAHGLGDARALDADGDGRQLHRGAGGLKFQDILLTA